MAVQHVRDRKLSVKKASEVFGIPRRTLREYVSKDVTQRQKPRRPPVLSRAQEEALKQRIFKLNSYGFPVTAKALR